MVLGANIGSAINPVLEGPGGDPVKLRLPIGNLGTRLVGTALAYPFLDEIAAWLTRIDPDPGRLAANFHTGFNLALRCSSSAFFRHRAPACPFLPPAPSPPTRPNRYISTRRRSNARGGARQRRPRGAADGGHRREDAGQEPGHLSRRQSPSGC
jgi:Na+/phosphate symporter